MHVKSEGNEEDGIQISAFMRVCSGGCIVEGM